MSIRLLDNPMNGAILAKAFIFPLIFLTYIRNMAIKV